MPEFHAEAPQATVSEGLAQGPYGPAKAGVEPMTLRMKGFDSTNAPHTIEFDVLQHYVSQGRPTLYYTMRYNGVFGYTVECEQLTKCRALQENDASQ